MALEDGLYKVQFTTPFATGAGVAHLHDGKLHGGDNLMAYVGEVTQKGDTAKVRVRIFEHSRIAGRQSILGVSAATLDLTGSTAGPSIQLSGTLPQAPSVRLSITLSRLGE